MITHWFDLDSQKSLRDKLLSHRKQWLVTGAAGFIGSNLVESLLHLDQQVIGFDNFATGHQGNLDHVEALVGEKWRNFRLVEGDIRSREACSAIVRNVDYILHQAALGSVPRSIDDPLTTHDVNITGFINMLDAARRANVKKFVYAASSSTYGDEPNLPKVEHQIGNPLSPYAVTKLVNEHYAEVYHRTFGFNTVGLRYFNVFGPRQDPDGAYAAVIPKWTDKMILGEQIDINGDGTTSRDFCFVANVVQANIRAALSEGNSQNQVYNVAVGDQTSLLDLVSLLKDGLMDFQVRYDRKPNFRDFREGDVKHSLASIEKAEVLLSYAPTHNIHQGVKQALPWYVNELRPKG